MRAHSEVRYASVVTAFVTILVGACGDSASNDNEIRSADYGGSSRSAESRSSSGAENTSDCGARPPNRCWYVDANAAGGGDGSFARPYNSFEKVVGFRTAKRSYSTGLLQGGDHLYLKGRFLLSRHIADGVRTMHLSFGNPTQGGSQGNPTVIRSYPDGSRAVFDGEYLNVPGTDVNDAGLLHFRTAYSVPLENLILENIEVTRASGLGISFGENVTNVEIIGVVVHETAIRKGAASSGAIHFRATNGTRKYTIRDSLLFNNYRNPGGVGYFEGASNNVGGISILSSMEVSEESFVEILDNVIVNEKYAVRHKHSGNVKTIMRGNIISNTLVGLYSRSRNSDVTGNLLSNVGTAIQLEAENQHADMIVSASDNSMCAVTRFLDVGYGNLPYARELMADQNAVFFTGDDAAFVAGRSSQDTYSVSQIQSSRNRFYYAPKDVLIYRNRRYGEADATRLLADRTSVFLNGRPSENSIDASLYSSCLRCEGLARAEEVRECFQGH